MSILQEYESIRHSMTIEQNKEIDQYLKANPEVLFSDLLYSKEGWENFIRWNISNLMNQSKIKLFDANTVDLMLFNDENNKLRDFSYRFTEEEQVIFGENVFMYDMDEPSNVYTDLEQLPFSRDGYNRYLYGNHYVLENEQLGKRFLVEVPLSEKQTENLVRLSNEIDKECECTLYEQVQNEDFSLSE